MSFIQLGGVVDISPLRCQSVHLGADKVMCSLH